jgi:hypothetical protein
LRFTWSRSIDAPFYRDIGVAPIRFRMMADVSHGKITSIVALVPPDDIHRIDAACRRRPVEPQIYGRPCSEFVRLIRTHAKSAEIPSERPRDDAHSTPAHPAPNRPRGTHDCSDCD